MTTRDVVELVRKHVAPHRTFEYWGNDAEFYQVAAKTPRSNCVLDSAKLIAAGIRMRPVDEALEHSLKNWIPEVSR